MKKEYSIAFGIWFAICIAAEIIGVSSLIWTYILLLFALIEGIAVARRKPGDTASENVWWWNAPGYVGRAVMVGALGVWMAYRFYSITPGGIGPGLLAIALASWVVPHFVTRGKTG